jgi:transposase
MAVSPRAELWGVRTHWAVRPLARAAAEWSFVRSISKSTVHRWLSQADLKPHRVRRWLHSPDPDFRAKVRHIVRLYLRPPRRSRVLCVDEKTQQQILERVHPTRPMAPGVPTRIEQTYRRHGVVATLAGLDVQTGHVILLVRQRRRHQEFLELLQTLRRRWPRGRLLIVADNLSIHTHPNVLAWVAMQQGQVQLVFLPLHASWLNQIELWFSILERQCLKRASLHTRAAMATRIYAFARHWNRTARPFRWTFKGYPLRR